MSAVRTQAHENAQKRLMYDSVTETRIQFLTSRSWWKPEYHNVLQARLAESYPETHVVAMPMDESLRKEFLTAAVAFEENTDNDRVVYVEEELGRCHDNVDELLQNGQIDHGVSGYALSDDGLWRYHSWGLKDGKIVETCEGRLVYYGLAYGG